MYVQSDTPLLSDVFENFCNKCLKIFQKQPSRGVLRKICSENMQQIYRKTRMPKCDAELKSHFGMGVLL